MKNSKGFTLIELMTVMAIISVLVGLITVSLSGSQAKSRNLERKAEVKAISDALEQYYAASGFSYPSGDCSAGLASYLKVSFPTDPTGGAYSGVSACTSSSYCICATLEGGGGNASDMSCNTTSWGSGVYYCVANLQ